MTKNRNIPSQDPLSFFFDSSEGTEVSARLPSVYSPPTLAVEGANKYHLTYSTDVNLTIRLKVNEFSRKQATILTGQALYEVAHFGLNLLDWMVLEFLYSYLLGSKREPLELHNEKELELALLLKIVLSSGTFMNFEEKVELPSDVLFLLDSVKWVPNTRTYQSRKNLFKLDKFLQVRIVPIDDLIERSKGTVRYSSYCKGYGESSQMGRRRKLRPSAELDGEPVDLEKESALHYPLSKISQLLQMVMLETKYTFRRKR